MNNEDIVRTSEQKKVISEIMKKVWKKRKEDSKLPKKDRLKKIKEETKRWP